MGSAGSGMLAVSIVVAMTLGIVVDDTVHFMLKYADARKEEKVQRTACAMPFARLAWR